MLFKLCQNKKSYFYHSHDRFAFFLKLISEFDGGIIKENWAISSN